METVIARLRPKFGLALRITIALSLVAFPVAVAGWQAVWVASEVSASHPLASSLPRVSAHLQAWLRSAGWLPWNAWAEILRHPSGFVAVGILSLVSMLWMLGVAAIVGDHSHGAPSYGGPPAAGRGEYGTARWREQADLRRTLHLWRPGDAETGILLGQGPEPGTAWVDTSESHVLLLGATGSRKSRGVILPTIGVIGSAARSSLVVTDPKGELYAHSSAWLASRGYRIVRFDLREPSRSNRWNPVQAVTDALADGRPDLGSTVAWDCAHLLTGSLEGRSDDPYWRLSAEGLIASLVLAVANGDPGGVPPRGEAVWRWPAPEERHMGTVYAALLSGGAGGGRLDDLMEQFPAEHPARKAYGSVSLTVDRTRASILGTGAAALRLFADDEVAWLVGAQDHSLAAAGEELTATFLVVPDERSTRYPLATLYVSQTLQALAGLADRNGGSLPVPVTFLLDEFGNLPQLSDFDKTVTVARSRRIRLVLTVQDLAQLKRHYGDAAHTLEGNLGTWIYLSTADLDTAKTISDKLGQYTVQAENLSVPRVTLFTRSAPPGQPDPVAANRNLNLTARDLLTPEEVIRWPAGQALILQARELPARLPLPDLSAWSRLWPELQTRRAEPPVSEIDAPPTWRPPSPGRQPGRAQEPSQARTPSHQAGTPGAAPPLE